MTFRDGCHKVYIIYTTQIVTHVTLVGSWLLKGSAVGELLFVRILSSIGHWAWIIISMLKLDVGGLFATAYANLIFWGRYLMS